MALCTFDLVKSGIYVGDLKWAYLFGSTTLMEDM